MASRRSRSNFKVIFEIHDSNNLEIDVHHALYSYLNFGLRLEAKEAIIRPQGGQEAI